MSAPVVHMRDIQKRQPFFTIWERQRNRGEVHWLMECFAETLGVFFYVFAGLGSVSGYVIGNIIGQPLSSLLQIGLAYAFGILMAIGVCSATSGGHFNPCITISYVVFKGFPPLKALRYIVAQILGAYIAALLVYAQYKTLIDLSENALATAGTLDTLQFTPNGPAGIFALYLLPGQTLGRAFLNEFVVDTMIALVIWAAIDPTNAMLPPVMSPVLVALSYGVAIWGFATPGVSLNTARDVGGRMLAMTMWGRDAAGGRYAAIAALTNIVATLFGAFLYEIFLTDSDRVVPQAQLDFANVMMNHRRNRPSSLKSRRQSRVQDIIELQNAGESSPAIQYIKPADNLTHA